MPVQQCIYTVHSLAVSVTFDKGTYIVRENDTLQIELILSEPLSSEVTFEVFTTDITGEHTYRLNIDLLMN